AAGADQMPAGTDGLEGRACRGRSLRQGRRDEQQGRGGRKDNKPQTHAAAPSCPGGIITTGTAGSSAAASRHSVQNLAEEQLGPLVPGMEEELLGLVLLDDLAL